MDEVMLEQVLFYLSPGSSFTIINSPLIHFHQSPQLEMCGSPDQAGCYHILDIYVGILISNMALCCLESMQVVF
jgi:hypothetical protein